MNKNIPILKPKGLIKIFEKLGFYIKRQKGSHVIMIKNGSAIYQPVIPFHKKDLSKALLKSIIRQAGFTIEEFNQLCKK